MITKTKSIFGIYSLRWRNAKTVFKWTPPFLAVDDGIALNALLDMSRECPDLQGKYLCQIGTFNSTTGEIKGCKARVVSKPKKGVSNEK